MSAVMVVISLITETIITTDTTTTANSVSIVPALTITVREENALIALHIIMVSVLLTIVIIMANVRNVPVSILTVKKVVNASIVFVLIIIVKGAPGMILIAYLCGSISSAILVCRLCGLLDPRTSGSGNPGATNVLRIGGKGAAVAVLIFDVLKGMLPVWGAYELGVSPFWLGLIAIAACLGHIWPVFFGFKGGKGVATAFGAIAPIGWDLTGVMAGTWLLTVLLSGYSSLGAIVSALIAPFYVWWFKPQFTFPVSMLSCLILLRHHDNIQRLWRRQETKIWTKFKRKREKDPE